MKFITSLPLFFMFLAFSANAEIALTGADILGTWSIDAESNHLDGSGGKKLQTTWTFNKDGTMTGESSDSQRHARVGTFRVSVKYRIEDGKLIKQVSPGRKKEDVCIVIEKEDPKMILKCRTNYFFMTKK
jgi:hypothetical protein